MDNMNYVCPVCRSHDWNADGKDANCMSCGNTTPLEYMKKEEPQNKLNMNEVMPEGDTTHPVTFLIND